MINSTGYIFDEVGYLSDCNKVPNKSLKYLYKLNYLVLDCLRDQKHPSHLNYEQALDLVKELKPKKTILTNLHVSLDYYELKKRLPKHIIPAYDGLSFKF